MNKTTKEDIIKLIRNNRIKWITFRIEVEEEKPPNKKKKKGTKN